jgi:hypothetical protein
MPAAANTASNAEVNLLSRSRMSSRNPVGVLVKLHQQIRGGLGDPGAGGVGGDPGQVHAPLLLFDDEEYVQPGQADRLDGEEVAGQGSGGLGA